MEKQNRINQLKALFDGETVAALLSWYRAHRRALPWRETRDPYRIWISEIMLQQTRVEAVKPYYARFLEAAPDVTSLSRLGEERLFKLWEGLGYYSRARNLLRAAQTVVTEYGGVMPDTYEGLRALPGIGDYTAGAIASIAYNLPVPAVDGNVLRVLSRVCAEKADITEEKTKQAFRAALSCVIPADAGDFTQALIELGATLCGPNAEAKCAECPLAGRCQGYAAGIQNTLPVKKAKKPRRIEEMTVFLIRDSSRTLLSKRPSSGLLAGLYELPNTRGHLDPEAAIRFVRSLGAEPLHLTRIEDAKHIFTHIEWHMIAYLVTVSAAFDGVRETERLFLAENERLKSTYAIPSAFGAYTKYLE